MKRLLLVLAILLPCCGGTPSDAAHDAPETTLESESAESPELAPTEPEGCGMAFSPPPELVEATEIAAARWSAATGCDVRVIEGGIPILSLAEVIKLDGSSDRARAVFDEGLVPNRIEIRSDHPDPVQGLLHEMGHILGGHGHSASGAMQSGNSSPKPIDLASLLLVCANLDCAALVAEQ